MAVQIYSEEGLKGLENALDGSFAVEGIGLDLRILSNTARVASARVAYYRNDVEEALLQPEAMRGKRHNFVREGKRGKLFGVADIAKMTAEERDAYLTAAQIPLMQLDMETNRLGYASLAYVSYVINNLHGVVGSSTNAEDAKQLLSRVKRYTPAIDLSKPVEGYPDEHRSIVSAIKESGLSSDQQSLLECLLNLKHTGHYFIESLRPERLKAAKALRDIPDGDISNMGDAFDAYRNNINAVNHWIRKVHSGLEVEMDLTRRHEILQGYLEHQSSSVFRRRMLAASGITGIAAAVVGSQQVAHWIEQQRIDLSWAPQIVNDIITGGLLFLTSSVVAGTMYVLLTLGSDIGRKEVGRLYRNHLNSAAVER